jgi:uncharacterized protein (TIGR02996 family)
MTPIQTTGDAILADIVAHPDDDGLRLVYADWLEEEGESPNFARFIRESLEPSKRCDSIRIMGGDRLTIAYPGLDYIYCIQCPRCLESATLCGGFIEAVRLSLDAWRKYGPALVRAHPLKRVELSDREPSQCLFDTSLWGFCWDFRGDPDDPEPSDLPPDLVAAFGWKVGDWTWFTGKEAAVDAISVACLAWARLPDGKRK